MIVTSVKPWQTNNCAVGGHHQSRNEFCIISWVSKRRFSRHHGICHCTVSQKFSVFVSQFHLLFTNLSSLVVTAFDGHVKNMVWAFGQQNFEYLRWIEIFLRHYFPCSWKIRRLLIRLKRFLTNGELETGWKNGAWDVRCKNFVASSQSTVWNYSHLTQSLWCLETTTLPLVRLWFFVLLCCVFP